MNFKTINLEHYDYFINDSLSLSDDEFVFLLPKKAVIFIKSGDKVISINIESIFFANGEFKQTVCNLLKDKTVVISDYKTASLYLTKELLSSAISVENLMRIKNEQLDVFNFVNSELNKEKFFETIDFVCDKFNEFKNLNEDEAIYYKNLVIKDAATDVLCNSFVYSNSSLDGLFTPKDNLYARKIQYSNKRAITGRIVCTDKFNIQNISHEDERRKSIISRFNGGCLINFDYNSFETRLSMFLTKDKEFIAKFSDKDLHEETAKIMFDKNIIDDSERKFAKDVNHAIIFGAGKDTVIKIMDNLPEKQEIYKEIKKFLYPIISKSRVLDEEYKKNGYIKNYFGTFVYPNKDYALYNNYVQSSAADIIARKIIAVNSILSTFKSKIISAIHDSILVDFHPEEDFLIDLISKEMRQVGEFEFNMSHEKTLNLFES